MDWVRVSMKEVEPEVWDLFRELREEQRVETGKIFGDMVQFYADHFFILDE